MNSCQSRKVEARRFCRVRLAEMKKRPERRWAGPYLALPDPS